VGKRTAFDDERAVPRCSAVGDLEWTLRYGYPTRDDLLFAASVCNVYTTMCLARNVKQFKAIVDLAMTEEVDRG